jgi:hypothetical protein
MPKVITSQEPIDDDTENQVIDDAANEGAVDEPVETDGEPEDEAGEGADADADDAGDDDAAEDGVSISLGEQAATDEEDEEAAKPWVKELRKSHREMARAMREKDAEIARLKGSGGQASEIVVGAEPTFESCDYDPDKFRDELKAWNGRKAQADQVQRERDTAQAAERSKWQTRVTAVQAEATKLKVADYDDAVEVLEAVFSPVQIGIVLGGPEDPKTSAALRYALGKNPKMAKELASISDPVRFAIAIGKLETKLKVTPRKSAPAPERMARSSVAGAAAVDNTLAKLQADADKTGNRTKVAAYLRNKAKQAA